MGIRETLNKNPAITTGATIAIIVIVMIVIVTQMRGPQTTVYTGTQVFFTDDDGATWFAADRENVPPFTDKNGLQAVRCYVFKCGKSKFVGYLEKYSDEARKGLNDLHKGPPSPGMPDPTRMMRGGRLLKKKGDKNWISLDPSDPASSSKIEDIMQVKCPDGSSDVTPFNPGD